MRKEDKLFEYAFGDLDAREAQVFEAGLLRDEVTSEEAKFLQSIKGDLTSLRDIPEMQYSKERLRHAILEQGLKPTRPGFPWLNWVLAPGAAACVLALGYFLMYGTSRKDPALLGTSPDMASVGPGAGPKLPVQELTRPSTEVATNFGSGDHLPKVDNGSDSEVNAAIETGISHYSALKSTHRANYKPNYLAMNVSEKDSVTKISDSVKTSASLAGAATVASTSQPEYSLEATASPKAMSAPTVAFDATLILIDKDQDSGLGAPTATEVNDTKNVVIGG